ncbi:hypothetical protein L210DRAFT_3502800 [Boletus edulis BED1]|uniref:MYND-type domain-containing protein n=1 Tax=Boletus edulis BED1 TaxID=1328754 RepID=A0AAD4GG03_BOLED|nr:hypothetical protein L210DRAFT_3502800 [Boletus edulis BED1]
MYETDINDAIKQLQAGSTRAPADLTLIAVAPACTLEQYHMITSAMYAVLDDAHLRTSMIDKSLPVQQALCLTSLASLIPRRYVRSGAHSTLQTLSLHWVELHRWILYLKKDFVDNENVDLAFRLLAKTTIVDFLGICDESFLQHMFDPIVASPDIIATLFSLWRMETLDKRFSLSVDPSTHPVFHIPATLDSWMCAFSQRERWDWSEILRPFGGEVDALAATALDHLQQDVARSPANYDLIVWDIHLITALSVNDAIRIPLLNQRSMAILATVINSLVNLYTTTNQHIIVAKCISYGYWYIRAYVESTDGLPWVTQLVETGLLSAMLSTEPWIKHLNGQDSEDWEPLFLLLGQIIPRYSVYSTVLKSMIKRLTTIDANDLPGKLEKDEQPYINMSLSNETHIESCQNIKCDKSGPPGSFKSCAGCLHVHYCGKECQVYDWKNGGHQKYCRDIQARRADGLVSRLSKRNVHFIDRVIAQNLSLFQDRIQATVMMLNLNPVVVELDFTEVPVQVDVGSVHSVAALKTCGCDVVVAQKWNHMIELAQKSTTKKVLVRAFLPAGSSEKVKLQCLPLKRILGDDTQVADEESMSEFDDTFDLLYSRAGQSFGIVDAAFPNEALRALTEKMVEGRRH